ncbi:MAG: NAD(P)-binding domain-containing protein, partial [Acidimicrobiia bacterium]|nr:NAD(P)-binding domain-containing protein [Acidimicrobiia bacterium]
MTSTAYNLVIVGGTAGALSVAISSQRSGLGLVRVLAAGNEVAFPALVGSEQLDIGYGEPVSSIDLAADGQHLVVTTAKQTYDTRAVMVAQRPPNTDWQPPLSVPAQRVHVDQVPDEVADLDVLVIGTTDHAVEVATALSSRGARVVLAAGGMDPARLSPSAERMLRRLERNRRATLLYRSTPESIGEVDGFPMVYFGDRRTPDLQFDHVVFAPPRRTLEPAALGITPAAVASGRVWFQGTSEAETGQQVSPGWRIGLDIARSCFPELDLPEPTPPTERLRRHSGALGELRAEHYNATITQFEPTHSDLWVLRVK